MTKYKVSGFAFIGRTFDEYCRMFALTSDELRDCSFLDCPGGACSFTAEAFQQNVKSSALDREYGGPADAFEEKCRAEVEKIKTGMAGAESLFNWSFYGDLPRLVVQRQTAAERFLADYTRRPECYIQGALPRLNLADGYADVVLSGHFLFLYGDRLDFDFHVAAVLELVRVARREVRIYPLIGLDGSPYAQMDALMKKVADHGHIPAIKPVDFEFLKGSNRMLVIQKTPA